VVQQLLLKLLDSIRHLMTLVHEVFCLLGLILEFASELVVLYNSNLRSTDLITCRIVEQVHFGSFDILQHFFPKVLNFPDLFSPDAIFFRLLFFYILVQSISQYRNFIMNILLSPNVLPYFLNFSLSLVNLRLYFSS